MLKGFEWSAYEKMKWNFNFDLHLLLWDAEQKPSCNIHKTHPHSNPHQHSHPHSHPHTFPHPPSHTTNPTYTHNYTFHIFLSAILII